MKNSDESHKITETVYKVNFILCRVLYVHHTCTLKNQYNCCSLLIQQKEEQDFRSAGQLQQIMRDARSFSIYPKKKKIPEMFVTDKSMPMHLQRPLYTYIYVEIDVNLFFLFFLKKLSSESCGEFQPWSTANHSMRKTVPQGLAR